MDLGADTPYQGRIVALFFPRILRMLGLSTFPRISFFLPFRLTDVRTSALRIRNPNAAVDPAEEKGAPFLYSFFLLPHAPTPPMSDPLRQIVLPEK